MATIQTNEIKLIEKIKQIETNPVNQYAIHFRLSKLLKRNSNEFQIKIALNVVNDFLANKEDFLFHCNDNDIFAVISKDDRDLLDKMIYQLRYLFADDPLAYERPNLENPKFCSVFLLKFQSRDFINICKSKLEGAMQQESQADTLVETKEQKFEEKGSMVNHLLNAYHFSKIEQDIEKIDIGKILRQQVVCKLQNGQANNIFTEILLSLVHLKYELNYDIQFTDNKLLFRYLVEKADEKMLEHLKKNIKDFHDKILNINLSVTSILSDKFDDLDRILKSTPNPISLIVDIDIADVFLDIHSYIYARDFLQNLGYKVCIDGLDLVSFVQIDREGLGADLLKVNWDDELIEEVNIAKTKEKIISAGQGRIILNNVESSPALAFGKDSGIVMYQGWFINRMINRDGRVYT